MVNIYTSDEYYQKNPSWHVEDSCWKAKQILKILKRNQIAPESVADLGCGAGEVLRQLGLAMDGGRQLHGYDISPKAIELAKSRETDQLKFFHQDLFEQTDIHYDLLMMIDVIEHIEDYLSFLRHVQSKGELKVLHIPLDLSVQAVIREFPLRYWREELGHIHFFSKDQAIQMLKDLGYEIIDYFYTKSILEMPQPTLLAKLSRLPIRMASTLSEDFSARLFGGFALMVLAR